MRRRKRGLGGDKSRWEDCSFKWEERSEENSIACIANEVRKSIKHVEVLRIWHLQVGEERPTRASSRRKLKRIWHHRIPSKIYQQRNFVCGAEGIAAARRLGNLFRKNCLRSQDLLGHTLGNGGAGRALAVFCL